MLINSSTGYVNVHECFKQGTVLAVFFTDHGLNKGLLSKRLALSTYLHCIVNYTWMKNVTAAIHVRNVRLNETYRHGLHELQDKSQGNLSVANKMRIIADIYF
jgi:hypothetical protein